MTSYMLSRLPCFAVFLHTRGGCEKEHASRVESMRAFKLAEADLVESP